MNIQTIIKNSAKVVNITNLEIGNVIKMVEKDYSGVELVFGVVTDILNSGDDAYVQVVTYKKSYSGVEVSSKLLSEKSEVTLFPAKPEDLNVEVKDILESMQKNIDGKEEEIKKIQDQMRIIDEVSKSLDSFTTPKFVELDK